MGKHFSPIELDNIHQWKSESCSPLGIHRRLVADRRRKRLAGPDLTTVRRHVKGKTFKRAVATETRDHGRFQAALAPNCAGHPRGSHSEDDWQYGVADAECV